MTTRRAAGAAFECPTDNHNQHTHIQYAYAYTHMLTTTVALDGRPPAQHDYFTLIPTHIQIQYTTSTCPRLSDWARRPIQPPSHSQTCQIHQNPINPSMHSCPYHAAAQTTTRPARGREGRREMERPKNLHPSALPAPHGRPTTPAAHRKSLWPSWLARPRDAASTDRGREAGFGNTEGAGVVI